MRRKMENEGDATKAGTKREHKGADPIENAAGCQLGL